VVAGVVLFDAGWVEQMGEMRALDHVLARLMLAPELQPGDAVTCDLEPLATACEDREVGEPLRVRLLRKTHEVDPVHARTFDLFRGYCVGARRCLAR
jgi:hypothetical protein